MADDRGTGSAELRAAVARLEGLVEGLSRSVSRLQGDLEQLKKVVAASGTRLEEKVDQLGKRLDKL